MCLSLTNVTRPSIEPFGYGHRHDCSISDMDDIFDETGDELSVARHDVQLIETIRYKDGFRDGLETSEQDAFETGFLRAYTLVATLIYDFFYEKERVRLRDANHPLLTMEMREFENELQSSFVQLKRPDEFSEEQQIETIHRFRSQLDQLQLKIQLALMSIDSK
jgi:hypothetical protein